MNYTNAKGVMEKFKVELEEMRKQATDGDTMPAEVFFMFMDILMPAFDGIIEEVVRLKEEANVSK